MPLSPNTAPAELTTTENTGAQLLKVLDHVATSELFAQACGVCQGKNWFYGHGSNSGDGSSFWKMDLDGNGIFDAIWEQARPRCEALTGVRLRVIRQYANGHTYGLGGRPHHDDHRPGTFTFLYYPMSEWKDEWDGETIYFDGTGEIALAVKLRPNRAVFFDSRILHVGRAPSRTCPALRITVAYKLEAVLPAVSAAAMLANAPTPTAVPGRATTAGESALSVPGMSIAAKEVRSEGSTRVHRFTIPAALIDASVHERLAVLAKTVKLPGFRGGAIPDELMRQRYGAEARRETLNRLLSAAINRALPKGTVPAQIEVKAGGDAGDAVLDVTGTYLPALPDPDLSGDPLERLTAPPGSTQGIVTLLRKDLRAQVLDRVDAAYPIPVLPALVDREFALIWKVAEMSPESMPETKGDPKTKAARRDEFRQIAERRVRLGWIVAELARRFDIRALEGSELEERVIDRLISLAPVEEREATQDELRQLAE